MKRVVVFLADGFEEIEGLTVVDILRRAGIEVTTVAIKESKEINGAHGIVVMADNMIDDIEFSKVDMVVLPGGMPGTLNLGDSEKVIEIVKEFDSLGKEVAAICAAPSILGDLGILADKKAVCYPGFEERLLKALVCKEQVVADGHITTSRGMGTAIPFALKLVEKLINVERAEEIRESIIY